MFHSLGAIRRTLQAGFDGRRVLVVGDLMLDIYLRGEVSRISPEAPVPIVRLSSRAETAGGAGNVLLNLAGLGISARAVGLIGDDPAGIRLLALLEQAGVDVGSVVSSTSRATVTKTRVIGGHQQMMRIDEEVSGPADSSDVDRMLAAIRLELAGGVDGIILSDYGKGALPDRACRLAIDEANRLGVPILVDPKGRDFRKYAGATALTPNRHEFDTAVGASGVDEPSFREAARRLRAELGLRYLVVTRSEKGVSVFEEGSDEDFPAVAREVFDVSGAGDTMIATIAAGLVAGHPIDDSLRLANLAAGVVVGKLGTVPIQMGELSAEVMADPLAEHSRKVCDLDGLLERGGRVAGQGAEGGLHQRLLRPAPRRPRHLAGPVPARGGPPDRGREHRPLDPGPEGRRAANRHRDRPGPGPRRPGQRRRGGPLRRGHPAPTDRGDPPRGPRQGGATTPRRRSLAPTSSRPPAASSSWSDWSKGGAPPG